MKIVIILVAVAVLLAVAILLIKAYLNPPNDPIAQPNSQEQDANPQHREYLTKIVAYLKENNIDISPGNPDTIKINSIENGEYEGEPALIAYMNCCYLGDMAFINEATKEVVGYKLGPK